MYTYTPVLPTMPYKESPCASNGACFFHECQDRRMKIIMHKALYQGFQLKFTPLLPNGTIWSRIVKVSIIKLEGSVENFR